MTAVKKAVPLLLIILLLTANVIYWGSRKEGFHVDEMLSYEQVGNTDYPKPTYDRPGEPSINAWHSREYYEDYLVIDSDEAFDLSAFYHSARRNGVHPPLYLTLLGMFISAVSPGHFTKWSGISLNILFFILTLLVVYDLAKRLLKKEKLALLAVFLTGISVGIVSVAIFIRPYSMYIFFAAAFADIHVLMLEKNLQLRIPGKKRVFLGLGTALLFILGALTQYYFLVFAFFMCLGFWLILAFNRERRQLIEYTLTIAGSFAVYYALWPKVLRDIFTGERGAEAVSNFTGAEGGFFTDAVHYFREIDLQTTGGFFFLLAVLLVIAIVFRKIKERSARLRSPEGEENNISCSGTADETVPGEKRKKTVSLEWTEVLLLLFPVVCYVLLIAKVAPRFSGSTYKTARYIVCIFPCTILISMFFLEKIFLKVYSERIWKRIIWPVMVLFIIAGYLRSGVEYLYPGASEQLEQLSMYSDDRALVITERKYQSSNLNVYLTRQEAVYQTNYSGLSDISSAFSDEDDNEIVVYIFKGGKSAEEVLEILSQELNAAGLDYLFITAGYDRADVYVMKLR